MFLLNLVLIASLVAAGAGFMLGGVPAAIFLGCMAMLVSLAGRSITHNGHAIFAGTLMIGVTAWYLGGVEVAVPATLLGFLVLLALHDHLMQKGMVLPIGLTVMLVAGWTVYHFSAGDVGARGMYATITSVGAFLTWVGIYDHYLQRTHAVRRNFPIIGWCRYGFELIGDELRQYWFMGDREEWPYNRTTRQYLYRSGKGVNNNVGYGTKEPYREVGKLHLLPSGVPIPDKEMGTTLPRLVIGAKRKRPYSPSWPIGVSHMSWGALSEEAVRALSSGARAADIHMGTGEGGYTPFHRDGVVKRVPARRWVGYAFKRTGSLLTFGLFGKPTPPRGQVVGGARIIVEIGPAKFGFRTLLADAAAEVAAKQFDKGKFKLRLKSLFRDSIGANGPSLHKRWSGKLDIKRFSSLMESDQNVMIVVKGGQGAKPGEGGKLPKEKITPQLSEWRGVPMDEDCYSPNAWDEWRTPEQLCEFGEMLSAAAGGKPWGYKTPVGMEDFLDGVAQYKKATGKGPDFIILDGGEGGTGAAPQILADSFGLPLLHAIPIIDNILRKHGIRNDTILVGAGQIAKGNDIIIAMAMGLDMVDIGRAFLIGGLGCIMAMRCHTNRCPVGITTQDPRLRRGLDPQDKSVRVANYGRVLQREILMGCKALGVRNPWELTRRHLSVVSSPMVSTRLSDIYPYPDDGSRKLTLAPALPAANDHDARGPKLTKVEPAPGTRLVP